MARGVSWRSDVARGCRFGAAVTLARGPGAQTVDLASRPDREAAKALYLRAGFTPRESNLHRITL
jgi:hypothetical protein